MFRRRAKRKEQTSATEFELPLVHANSRKFPHLNESTTEWEDEMARQVENRAAEAEKEGYKPGPEATLIGLMTYRDEAQAELSTNQDCDKKYLEAVIAYCQKGLPPQWKPLEDDPGALDDYLDHDSKVAQMRHEEPTTHNLYFDHTTFERNQNDQGTSASVYRVTKNEGTPLTDTQLHPYRYPNSAPQHSNYANHAGPATSSAELAGSLHQSWLPGAGVGTSHLLPGTQAQSAPNEQPYINHQPDHSFFLDVQTRTRMPEPASLDRLEEAREQEKRRQQARGGRVNNLPYGYEYW